MLSQVNVPDLVARIVESGGITVGLDGKSPHAGFAVSIPGHEVKHRWILTSEYLADYIRTNAVALSTPGAHIGAWWDSSEDTWYLDTSIVVENERAALRLGAEWKQKAVYDLTRGQAVLVPQWLEYADAV
jgi:hypothetical protein